jgi:hypothetical protein
MITYNKNEVIQNNAEVQLWKKERRQGVTPDDLECGPMASFCEHDSKPSYSNKTGFLHLLKNKRITFQGRPCILTCLVLQEYTRDMMPKTATMD